MVNSSSSLSQLHIELLQVQASYRRRVHQYEINKEYSRNEYTVHAVCRLDHVHH